MFVSGDKNLLTTNNITNFCKNNVKEEVSKFSILPFKKEKHIVMKFFAIEFTFEKIYCQRSFLSWSFDSY